MGLFGNKQVQDKPLEYHACTVSTLIGLQMRSSIFEEHKTKTGGAVASVLNLYAGTLPAPALLNHLAIGIGVEFEPCWQKDFVRTVLTNHPSDLEYLKDSFIQLSKGAITTLELAQAIVITLGYPADSNELSQYEDGLVSLTLGVIADLAEKVQHGTRNGLVSQDGSDAYIQGVVASMFLGLLLVSEKVARNS